MVCLLFAMLVVLYGCGGPAFTTSASADTADTGMRDAGEDQDGARRDDSSQPLADSSMPDSNMPPPDSGFALDSSPVDSSPVDAEPDVCAPVTHANGLGQTWTDCVPLGTYNEAQAMKACVALNSMFDAALGSCIASGCGAEVIVENVGGGGGVWTYAGPFTGYAAIDNCPTGADPMWR